MEQAGSFLMLGAGITIYNETGFYGDVEYATGSDRSELALSLGKSFGGYALFAGYKTVSMSEVEIPQFNDEGFAEGDPSFDVDISGLFFGGSKNIALDGVILTTSTYDAELTSIYMKSAF